MCKLTFRGMFSLLIAAASMIVGEALVGAVDRKPLPLPPIDDLAAAAGAVADELAPALASADTFEKAKDLKRPAYVLALLANAVAMADGSVQWKGSAAQVRDAALRLARTESYNDASSAFGEIKGLLAGGATNASQGKPMMWVEIAPLKELMVEVNVRNRSLTKMVRTPAQFKQDAEKMRRNAAVLELFGSITAEHPKPKDGKGSDEEWQKWSAAMRDGAAALAKTAKTGDAPAAKTALNKMRASCSDCHAKFRPDVPDDF